ncbi:unnamed protein product (macronuclear) [Paramecium tetraurelia]|uniref:RING-type domain-containing protein n=1 Tax=Paramecium tetraurelia TaxID=5888 RepID=A0C2M4_PARTE|nr:uncharacterized protein GSPATT00034519001 [Paramecium tetraurelia]CAK65041.1 unnamed protein product [Paramecium tetraurelia]|eukprot:XP_001432438.1 hypothetical protein (macronuclear) [Paramecium tetraurelia strain d4-2]
MSSEMDFLSIQKVIGEKKSDILDLVRNRKERQESQRDYKQVDKHSKRQQIHYLKTNQKLRQILKKQQMDEGDPQDQWKIKIPGKIEHNQISQEELKKMIEDDEQLKTLPLLDIQIKEQYFLRKIENHNNQLQLKQQYQELKLKNDLLEQKSEEQLKLELLRIKYKHKEILDQLEQKQEKKWKSFSEFQKNMKQLQEEHNQFIKQQQYQQQKQKDEQKEEQFKNEQEKEKNYIDILFKKTKVLSEDNLECSICSQEFRNGEKLALLNCIHRFHEICFKQWSQKSNQCPYCQYRI